jgi:muramoyltetrapeptide carboxypeptidase
MNIIFPPALQKGSHIKIVCPSGYLPIAKALQAQSVLEQWGYKVTLGKTTQTEYFYFSGTDAQRLADLQEVLDDTTVAAILMGRGGYGLSRIIDDLNFDTFKQHPKWIIGFSDITVLHAHIFQTMQIATLHAPMCSAFAVENLEQEYMKTYQQVLRGSAIQYQFLSNVHNVQGIVTGQIVGGNLCMLEHLTGSVSQLDTRDKILFIEDIGEHLYKIDRMLYNLKRSGQLSTIKGLVCGNFSDIEDTTRPFGQNLYQIITSHISDWGIPVAFDIPIGHETINYPLVLGANYILDVQTEHVVLQQLDGFTNPANLSKVM